MTQINIINPGLQWREPLTPLPVAVYDTIAIHHPAAVNCTIQDIHQWHLQNGWKGAAYGYYVRKDGSIYLGRGLNEGGGVYAQNGHVLSICAEGNYDTTDTAMPAAQAESLAWLLEYLRPQLPNLKQVVGHLYYGGTTCPGQQFPLQQFTDRIPAAVRNLRMGMTGEDVRALQVQLNECGSALTPDGRFGPATETEVKAFQHRNGLDADGVVGPMTRAALETAAAQKLTDWREMVRSVSDSPDRWIVAINTAASAAAAPGDMGALEVLRYLPDLVFKLYHCRGAAGDWQAMVRDVADSPEPWVAAINVAVAMAVAPGDTGALETLRWLPELITKLYRA